MTGLVVHTADAGGDTAPTGLVFPDGTGEVADLGDVEAVARWLRAATTLERDHLRPAKRVATDVLYHTMDARLAWTIHLEDGWVARGESREAWQSATTVDAEALHADLVVLYQREHPSATTEEAAEFAAGFFKTERTLTAAGRNRLEKGGGVYAELLRDHTTPIERSRAAVTLKKG